MPSSGSKVTLTWSGVAGADFYRVYRGTSAGGESRYMQSTPGMTSIVYTGSLETVATPPTATGKPWNVKNLLELKNAQRVLIDGNIFEHWWAASQKGYAILFTPRNQYGTAPWAVVRDITLTNNVIRHVAGAIDILGTDYDHPSQRTTNIVIRNNLVFDVSSAWGSEHFLLITGAPPVTVDHNTIHQEADRAHRRQPYFQLRLHEQHRASQPVPAFSAAARVTATARLPHTFPSASCVGMRSEARTRRCTRRTISIRIWRRSTRNSWT